MTDNNKIQEFLQKLTPCIERSDLDACVEEAARVVREMGMGAGELLDCPRKKAIEGYKKNKSNKTYMDKMGEPSLKRKNDDLIREEEIRGILFEKCKKELSLGEKELVEIEIVREKAWKETKNKYGL